MSINGLNQDLIVKLRKASEIRKASDIADVTQKQIDKLKQELEQATLKLSSLRAVESSYKAASAPETKPLDVSKPRRQKADLIEVSGQYKPRTGIKLALGSQNQICYDLVNRLSPKAAIEAMEEILKQRNPGRDMAWYNARASKYVRMALNGSLGQV